MTATSADAALLEVVSAFAQVSLDEIVERADLQTRTDRKYVVPREHVGALLRDLDSSARVLTIDGRTQFSYRSAYFDTDDLSSYLAAARRRPARYKVRVRSYTDTGLCMLEVKTRDKRGRTVKHRVPTDSTAEIDLTPAGRQFIAGIDQTAELAWDLNPSLTTRYRRITFLLHDGARITLDTDLTWHTTGGECLELGDFAIIETKTTGRPCGFDRLLWRAGYRPEKFSKYCTGLAAIDRRLPSHRWNRVLRRYVLT